MFVYAVLKFYEMYTVYYLFSLPYSNSIYLDKMIVQ